MTSQGSSVTITSTSPSNTLSLTEGATLPLFKHYMAIMWLEAEAIEDGSAKAALGHDMWCWHTHVYCACHDASHALKWSLQPCGQQEILDNLFTGAAAFRHGNFCAPGPLDSWFPSVLQLMHAKQLPRSVDLRYLWTTLGIQHDIVKFLSKRVKLHWADNIVKLCIDEDYVRQAQNFKDLSRILLTLWSFRSFTLSRWGAVGLSARSVLIGLLTGFHRCLAEMRRCKHVNGYCVAAFESLLGKNRFGVTSCQILNLDDTMTQEDKVAPFEEGE